MRLLRRTSSQDVFICSSFVKNINEKTKLTLNIDDKIIGKAKKFASRKYISLSFVVEDYLAKFSRKNISQQKGVPRKKD